MARSKSKIRRKRHRWVVKHNRRKDNRKIAQAAPASATSDQAAAR